MEKVYIVQPIVSEHYRELRDEAISLVESAGGEYCGTLFQTIREVSPATYIGSGKLAELYERIHDLDVTVLFNGDLTPSQTLNISAALGEKKVIDRTTLILDIFAKNAQTSEGKMQIELAQLNYIYPRLKGKGSALSRLGGGIGTRGPGETQLETDRRHIRRRINYLKERMAEMERRRALQIDRRKKNSVKTLALVGYTNVGKSTLLNALTGADVFVKDALFATLDPTARRLTIEGTEFLLVDTVGFLQDLPHHLIEAFHSTLESALSADLALLVCDGTGNYEMQLETTKETLLSMGFHGKTLTVVNKSESLSDFSGFPADAVFISAKEKVGLEHLKSAIFQAFEEDFRRARLFIPYAQIAEYNAKKKLLTERGVSYTEEGSIIDATIPVIYFEQFRPYLTQS
ncbi:MAG: GTPase HflX [Clostridia bacterium]|nr:GTPase HflX [Clostridia bacterium]